MTGKLVYLGPDPHEQRLQADRQPLSHVAPPGHDDMLALAKAVGIALRGGVALRLVQPRATVDRANTANSRCNFASPVVELSMRAKTRAS